MSVYDRPGTERVVITLILKNKELLHDVIGEGITPKHFSVKGHNVLFTVLQHLILNEGVEVLDSLLIYNTIPVGETKEAIDDIGGLQYIDSLFSTFAYNNMDVYIKQLKEAYKVKNIYEAMNEAMVDISGLKPIDTILSKFDTRLGNALTDDKKSVTYKVGTNILERLEARRERGSAIKGYSVGWEKFDKLGQGLQENDLVVICAPSKTGKSMLLANIAERLCSSGLGGSYFDTEMSDEEFDDRLLSIVSGVPIEEIGNGMCYLDTPYGKAVDKTEMIKEAVVKIKSFNIYHEFIPEFNIESVTALAKKHKRDYDVDFIIFDYLKLPNEDATRKINASEYERLGYFTTCLKDIAGVLKLPVITACQSNRSDVGSTEPNESSIQGSYKILQMASKLYFLRNKTEYEVTSEGYRYGNMKLHIKFQRNGTSNESINIQFDRTICRMREVD